MSETTKLFIITGHGDGDCGAVGHGFQEAERVRTLAKRVKYFGGDNVTLCDMDRNYYKDKLINTLDISKDFKLLELHLDCDSKPSPKGGHVVIKAGYKADKYDTALAEMISDMFPGRSVTLSKRDNLANVNRAANKGYNYRLMECCFISNADDIAKFNANIDVLAKNILKCFDIPAKEEIPVTTPTPAPSQTTKSLDDWAKEVINGKHGSGHANREASLKKAGCTYDYETVRNRVNELCGAKVTTTTTPTKSLDEWAKEVINGKHGNGHANREASLKKAGCTYTYAEVRERVNQLSK